MLALRAVARAARSTGAFAVARPVRPLTASVAAAQPQRSLSGILRPPVPPKFGAAASRAPRTPADRAPRTPADRAPRVNASEESGQRGASRRADLFEYAQGLARDSRPERRLEGRMRLFLLRSTPDRAVYALQEAIHARAAVDSVHFNLGIQACILKRNGYGAWRLVKDMEQLGVLPVQMTYGLLFEAFARNKTGSLVFLAERIRRSMLLNGIAPTTQTLTSYLRVFARGRVVDDAFSLAETGRTIDELKEDTQLGTPVEGYPDGFTVAALASGCSTPTDRARLYEFMQKRGFEKTRYVAESLLKAAIMGPDGLNKAVAQREGLKRDAKEPDSKKIQEDTADDVYEVGTLTAEELARVRAVTVSVLDELNRKGFPVDATTIALLLRFVPSGAVDPRPLYQSVMGGADQNGADPVFVRSLYYALHRSGHTGEAQALFDAAMARKGNLEPSQILIEAATDTAASDGDFVRVRQMINDVVKTGAGRLSMRLLQNFVQAAINSDSWEKVDDALSAIAEFKIAPPEQTARALVNWAARKDPLLLDQIGERLVKVIAANLQRTQRAELQPRDTYLYAMYKVQREKVGHPEKASGTQTNVGGL